MTGPEHFALAEELLAKGAPEEADRDYYVAAATAHAILAQTAATIMTAKTTRDWGEWHPLIWPNLGHDDQATE